MQENRPRHLPEMDDIGPSLVKRIERLERQNRLLRLTSLLGLILFSGVLFMAQSHQVEKLTAGRFELVDRTGKIRAALGMTATGPALLLVDERGTTRVSLNTTATGSSLKLYDAVGETEGGAFEVDASSREFRLHDKSGKVRAGVLVGGKGPALILADAGGKPRISLDVKEGPGLSIIGSTGNIGLALSVDDKNNPEVLLYDSSSKLRTELTAGDEFRSGTVWPGLFLHDPAGRIRASLFVSEMGAPLFALSDADGKLLFSKP
jgi:hypothetical protein